MTNEELYHEYLIGELLESNPQLNENEVREQGNNQNK